MVSTQSRSIKTYNQIVEKQFLLHMIPARMDAVDKLSRICSTHTPPWLSSTMIKLYQQMDKIRVHGEKKCRKFLTPEVEYSPVFQHWYDKIHAYMDLLKLKEGVHNEQRQCKKEGQKEGH